MLQEGWVINFLSLFLRGIGSLKQLEHSADCKMVAEQSPTPILLIEQQVILPDHCGLGWSKVLAM